MDESTNYVQFYNGLSKLWYKVETGNGKWEIRSTSPVKFAGVPEHVKGKSYRKSKAKFDNGNNEKSEVVKEVGNNNADSDSDGLFY